MLKFQKMTVAEDATTTEEVPAEALAREVLQHQEAREVQVAEVSTGAKEALRHDVKAVFHRIEAQEAKAVLEAKHRDAKAVILKKRRDDQIHQGVRAVLPNAHREDQKVQQMRQGQNAQGKDNIC